MIGTKQPVKLKNCMRVCIIIDAWEPVWGGGQEHVWQIISYLRHKDYTFDIYTRSLIDDNGKKYTCNEYKYHNKINIFRVGFPTSFFNLYGRLIWIIYVILVIYQNHHKKRYSVIHAHAYIGAIPGKILNKILKVPVIFTVHGSNNMDSNKQTFIAILEKFLLTGIKFDKEISVSRHFLRYKNVNQNISVIPNGVNISEFNRIIPVTKDKKNFCLLFVGRFDRIKGIDLLIKAFAKIQKVEKNVRLNLVGYGYEEKKLKELSANLGINNKIEFYSKKKHIELIQFYKRADIFILPSYSEGQSITLLEACAAKLPIIATDVGDNKLLVKNNYNGFLINKLSEKDIINAITKAIKIKNLKLMGIRSYGLITEYSWKNAGNKLDTIYKNFLT